MDKTAPAPDWTLMQSFLAVAETGSLSAAARALRQSQPTLGRHIRKLEQHLGTEIFHRRARGLALTETGERLLPMARRMRDAMHETMLTAARSDARVGGTVRISASVFAAHYVLPPILARLRIAVPAVELVLAPSDETESLAFRQADIAVRMYRPTQLDTVTRHVADLPLGVFAARSYLDRAGRPERMEDLRRHDLVGYDRNELIRQTVRNLGWDPADLRFPVRCDNQATYWELVRAGCGIGFSQTGVARADPEIVELPLGLDLPPLPVWLAAHEAVFGVPRIRAVWPALAEGLAQAGIRAARAAQY